MAKSRIEPWGLGQAALVKPAATKKEGWERVVLIPDTHVPYQDKKLVASALKLIEAVDPHRVIHLGDLCDLHSISRWNASLERLDDLQDELDEGAALLARLRDAAPNAVIDYTAGNHCERLRRFIMEKGRALASLRSLDLASLFKLEEQEINLYPGGLRLREKFIARHGSAVRQGAGNSAKSEALASMCSGASGHTHRAGLFTKTGYGTLQWAECGTLSRVDAPYVAVPDWQQAMGYVELSTKTDAFHLTLAPAVDGKLRLGRESF